jgi:flavin reductase (DIM6/NTAB) family NADH-FMN oxidoreductase RutF
MRRDSDSIGRPAWPPPNDPAVEELRQVLRRCVTGVTVVTGLDTNGALVGMTVNSFTSASFEPPLILVCLAYRSRSYGSLIGSRRFTVNVLSEDQAEIARAFAVRGGDRSGICGWASPSAAIRFSITISLRWNAGWSTSIR